MEPFHVFRDRSRPLPLVSHSPFDAIPISRIPNVRSRKSLTLLRPPGISGEISRPRGAPGTKFGDGTLLAIFSERGRRFVCRRAKARRGAEDRVCPQVLVALAARSGRRGRLLSVLADDRRGSMRVEDRGERIDRSVDAEIGDGTSGGMSNQGWAECGWPAAWLSVQSRTAARRPLAKKLWRPFPDVGS